jgi:hypothetical protein
MSKHPLILIIALTAWSLAAPPAASQEASGPPLCTRGEPAPACRTFLVVEAAAGRRSSGGIGELDLSWQAGVLTNRGRSALGWTAYAAVGLDVRAGRPMHDWRFGVLPRYRRWLSRSASVDLSAGPVVELQRGGAASLLSTHLAVGWANDLALSGHVDLGGENGPAWFVGARVGSGQVTGALEAQGIALIVWGIVRLSQSAVGQ